MDNQQVIDGLTSTQQILTGTITTIERNGLKITLNAEPKILEISYTSSPTPDEIKSLVNDAIDQVKKALLSKINDSLDAVQK